MYLNLNVYLGWVLNWEVVLTEYDVKKKQEEETVCQI